MMDNNELTRMDVQAKTEIEKHKVSEERATKQTIATEDGQTERQKLREPTKKFTMCCLTAIAIVTVIVLCIAIWRQPSCVEQISTGLVHALLVLVGAAAATASSVFPQQK